MNRFNISDIHSFDNHISSDNLKEELLAHCNKVKHRPFIISWYSNFDELVEDSIDDTCSFTITEAITTAREKLNCETGAYFQFSNGEIVRLH